MKTFAHIKITYEEAPDKIKQIISIEPEKKKYLKYFIYNKFSGGRRLEDRLTTFYAGDGDNIFFRGEKHVKNKIILFYTKKRNIPVGFENIEFTVWTVIPQTEGCDDCKFYAETERYNICKAREMMNFKKRKKCVFFEQRD